MFETGVRVQSWQRTRPSASVADRAQASRGGWRAVRGPGPYYVGLGAVVFVALMLLPTRWGRVSFGMSAEVRSDLSSALLAAAVIGVLLLGVERALGIALRSQESRERALRVAAVEALPDAAVRRLASSAVQALQRELFSWWRSLEAQHKARDHGSLSVVDITDGSRWERAQVQALRLPAQRLGGAHVVDGRWVDVAALVADVCSDLFANDELCQIEPASPASVKDTIDPYLHDALEAIELAVPLAVRVGSPEAGRRLMRLRDRFRGQRKKASGAGPVEWVPPLVEEALRWLDPRQPAPSLERADVLSRLDDEGRPDPDWWTDPGQRAEYLTADRL